MQERAEFEGGGALQLIRITFAFHYALYTRANKQKRERVAERALRQSFHVREPNEAMLNKINKQNVKELFRECVWPWRERERERWRMADRENEREVECASWRRGRSRERVRMYVRVCVHVRQ